MGFREYVRRWFCGRGGAVPDAGLGAEAAGLGAEAAGLRLELQEARALLEQSRARADALEASAAQSVRQSVDARVERLLAGLASPIAQLRLQGHLLESGREVCARDVMALADGIASGVEQMGLERTCQPEERTAFDPDTMAPLRAGEDIRAGDPVTVKLIGFRHAGGVLLKALVEKEQ